MSSEAFGTRRVTESLKAIRGYLDDAATIAGSVATSETVKIDRRKTPRWVQPPRLDKITWFAQGTSTSSISLPPAQSTQTIRGVGKGLQGIRGLVLHGPNNDLPAFRLDIIESNSESFTARGQVHGSEPGWYALEFKDAFGQSHTRPNACSIAALGPLKPIELGEIEPSRLPAESGSWPEFILTILSGYPEDFKITDLDGNDQHWTVDAGDETSECGCRVRPLKITPSAEALREWMTQVTSPSSRQQAFCLVALAGDGEAQDRLRLTITLPHEAPGQKKKTSS